MWSMALSHFIGAKWITILRLKMPVWFHYLLASFVEGVTTVPLVSRAQARMVSEGLAEPNPPCDALPEGLAPRLRFTAEQIRKGLPAPGPFGLEDRRCCYRHSASQMRKRIVFLEFP
jgi:hypothetical protein